MRQPVFLLQYYSYVFYSNVSFIFVYVLYLESYDVVLGIDELRVFYSKVDWGFLKSAESRYGLQLTSVRAACFDGLCSLDVFDVFRSLWLWKECLYSVDIVLLLWIVWQDPVSSECKRWFEVWTISTMRIVCSPRRCAVYCILGCRFVCLFRLSANSLRCWVWFLQ